ncbi:MAG: GIY-YIG nuclease family protein [Terriglobia bacterium]
MHNPDAAIGIIYVLTNDKKTWAKIGRTSAGTALGRASDYGRVHGHKWTVFAQLTTLRVEEVEANIHDALATKRVRTDTNAREIFNIKPAQAVEIARSMIVPPNGSPEQQKVAISTHAAKVRRRLHAQASFLMDRADRSRSNFSLSGPDAIRIYVAPQLLSLDAWEKGITTEAMLAQYRATLERREAEIARLEQLGEDYERQLHAAYIAARKAQSWWSMLKNEPLKHHEQIGPRPNIKIDDTSFPGIPRYARILIDYERQGERQRAERARLLAEDAAKPKHRWWR